MGTSISIKQCMFRMHGRAGRGVESTETTLGVVQVGPS
jgi:hypothetical protein